MRTKIFIILLFTFLTSNAQSLLSLDQKNGFKHFKFGSEFSTVKNVTKSNYSNPTNTDIKEYLYTGSDITSISGVNIDDIKLSFYKNKLFSIRVSFGSFEIKENFTVEDFDNILYALKQTYGNEWQTPTNKTGIIANGAIWKGNKVTLELLRIDYTKDKVDPQDYGYIGGYLHIFDNKLMKEMYSGNF